MAKQALKPPKKHKVEYYDYNEVANYLEKLHKKHFRDYAGKFGKNNPSLPYQDFWHMVCDNNETMMNGSFIYLPDFDYYMNNAATQSWQKEIMQFFYDFLGDDYCEKMWVSW